MQYYHAPENLDAGETISALGRLFSAMRVSQLKILGGEPFVCQKQLIQVLFYLKEAEERFDEIDIITNGTILPSEECIRVIRDTPKIKIIFSNYGELSSKLDEFTEILRQEKICFEIVEDEFWWDFGALKPREEKAKKTQHRYDGCYSRRLCTTLYRGRLYVCPRQAHGIRLGLIPAEDDGVVDLTAPELEQPSRLRDAVYGLIERKEHITCCRYCGCDAGIKVQRALQAERPLDDA